MPRSTEEALAVLTALQKMVKERLDEARAEADEAMLRAYDVDGVSKKALKVGGAKVGDYTVVLSADEWEVTDRDALEDFALCNEVARRYSTTPSRVERAVRPEWRSRALDIVEAECPEAVEATVKLDSRWQACVTNRAGLPTYLDSGEIIPGLRYTGRRPKGTQVRGCEPADVLPLLRAMPGGVDALLLGAGDDAPDMA